MSTTLRHLGGENERWEMLAKPAVQEPEVLPADGRLEEFAYKCVRALYVRSCARSRDIAVIPRLTRAPPESLLTRACADTRFLSHLCRGNLAEVKRMLERNADVNSQDTVKDGYGWTAVNSAAAAGHSHVVALLVRKGADMTKVNAFGHTPLHSAAARGHMHVVSFIAEVDQDFWEQTDEYKNWLRREGQEKRFDESPFWVADVAYLDKVSLPSSQARTAAQLANVQDHDFVKDYLDARKEQLQIVEARRGTNRAKPPAPPPAGKK
jgi:hypothetical protein